MNELRKLPQADGPEKSILSSMLQDPVEFVPRAIEMGVTPAKFYNPAHGRLFATFVEKQNRGEVIELIDLSRTMIKDGSMEGIGGPSALTEIYTYAPSTAHFESHAKDVIDASTMREIIKFGSEVIRLGYDSEDVSEAISKLELGALTIGQDADSNNSYDYSLKCAYKELLAVLQAEGKEGIPTGFQGIDLATGGLHPGEIMVIGARPAVGKTAFAISLAENLAIHNNVPTALFVVEGKRTYLTTRLMAMVANISAKRIRDKVLAKGDISKIQQKMVATKDAPLRIDDRISSAVEIAAKIRRMHQVEPLKVVIIDYIQKLPSAMPEERSDLRLRIINATDVLHQTCKSLGIALVLLAQLGRGKGRDPMTDPRVDDLKESGSLEQDGDTIILLANKGEAGDEHSVQEKLARVDKNRHGPCADLPLSFNPQTTRFY
jgi:replicative DNA helicase